MLYMRVCTDYLLELSSLSVVSARENDDPLCIAYNNDVKE